MKVKTTERISRWILTLAALTSLVVALGLLFNPLFPLRSYLYQQRLLESAIGLFGVLAAGFIAALALLYINKQTQTYIWRRDQALKDIETIYEPLFIDISKIDTAMKNFIYIRFDDDSNWESINSSYLGAKLKLMDSKLHDRIDNIFKDVENYNNQLSMDVVGVEKNILEKLIEPYVEKNIEKKERQAIIDVTANHMGYIGRFDQGSLMCKSVDEWALLAFKKTEAELIEYITEGVRTGPNAGHLQSVIEQIESIVKQFWHETQSNTEIQQFRDWCKTLYTDVTKIKKELENLILKPQLP